MLLVRSWHLYVLFAISDPCSLIECDATLLAHLFLCASSDVSRLVQADSSLGSVLAPQTLSLSCPEVTLLVSVFRVVVLLKHQPSLRSAALWRMFSSRIIINDALDLYSAFPDTQSTVHRSHSLFALQPTHQWWETTPVATAALG